MIEKLFESVRAALAERWNGRLPDILAKAHSLAAIAVSSIPFGGTKEAQAAAVREAVRAAYLAGYRQAYWDGIVDFVEVGLEVESAEAGGSTGRRSCKVVH